MLRRGPRDEARFPWRTCGLMFRPPPGRAFNGWGPWSLRFGEAEGVSDLVPRRSGSEPVYGTAPGCQETNGGKNRTRRPKQSCSAHLVVPGFLEGGASPKAQRGLLRSLPAAAAATTTTAAAAAATTTPRAAAATTATAATIGRRGRAEAVGAVDWTVTPGIEGDLGLLATLGAHDIVHFATYAGSTARTVATRRTGSTATGITAGSTGRSALGAATGLVGESLGSVELLLAGGEREGHAAIDAREGLVVIHSTTSWSDFEMMCREPGLSSGSRGYPVTAKHLASRNIVYHVRQGHATPSGTSSGRQERRCLRLRCGSQGAASCWFIPIPGKRCTQDGRACCGTSQGE